MTVRRISHLATVLLNGGRFSITGGASGFQERSEHGVELGGGVRPERVRRLGGYGEHDDERAKSIRRRSAERRHSVGGRRKAGTKTFNTAEL